MRAWLKFVVTQLINVPLMLIGLPVCAALAVVGTFHCDLNIKGTQHIYKFPRWAWVWSNDEDGVFGAGTTPWDVFYWTAIRNPVDNLKYATWPFEVATPGGPLAYKTWFWFGKQFYYKIGYMPHEGYPACQLIGGGRGW